MIAKKTMVPLALLAMALVACGPPPGPSTTVQRIDPNAAVSNTNGVVPITKEQFNELAKKADATVEELKTDAGEQA